MTTPALTPDQLLTTTRSVRRRLDLDRPVPLELVRECLEVAVQAPTGSNRQGWHWVVVTDQDTRRQIGGFYQEAVNSYLDSRATADRLFADDPERAAVQQRIGASVRWLAERMGSVPVLLIACIQAARTLPPGNQAGLWGSLLPAAWSYMLAARARGLGTAWTTLHLRHEAEIAALLRLPEGIHQGVLIPTAYYTGETFSRAPRQPLDRVLHVDAW